VSDERWDVLGIAPTDDPAAVRRAYAARLKLLDVDRDPAAFIRLRAALDDALAGTFADVLAATTSRASEDDQPAVAPEEETLERIIATFVPGTEPEDEFAVPYGALGLMLAAFEATIEAGDTRAAAETLQQMLAQGIVPFGEERQLVGVLVASALADPTLSEAELDAIAGTFDAAEVRERIDAMRWWRRVKADAARGSGFFGAYARYLSRPTRVARSLFREKHDLLSTDLPALRTEVGKVRRYARWLPDGLDPDAEERKLVKLEKTLRGQEIVAVIIFLFIVGLLFGLGHFMNAAVSGP
jgi:hypothetical protein